MTAVRAEERVVLSLRRRGLADMAEKKKTTTRKTTTRKKKVAPTHEQIATRAYFVSLDEPGRGELDNWLRAERELATA